MMIKHRPSKKLRALHGATVLLLYLVSHVQASFVIDTFESYPDTSSLESVWVDTLGSPMQFIETTGIHSGLQALGMDYDVSSVPHTDSLAINYSEDQDWSAFDTLSLWHRAAIGNSTDFLLVQIRDEFGGILRSSSIHMGTTLTSWTFWSMSLVGSGNIDNGTTLENVRSVQLHVVGALEFGAGRVFIDDIGLSTIPEPTSLAYLMVGGAFFLLVQRRAHTNRGI